MLGRQDDTAMDQKPSF